MNNDFVCLPSLPSFSSESAAPTVLQVVTPFCHKADSTQKEMIMPLPEVAEKIEPPKQALRPEAKRTPVPAKKLEVLKKKFEKLEKDVKKEVKATIKAKPVEKASPKKFDKAPVAKVKAKAKPVAKKPVAKAKKK